MARRSKKSVERSLAKLSAVKGDFVAASGTAATSVRSCRGCDAHCCKVGLNSMRVVRIEAAALRKRLEEPDLAPLLPEILDRARAEIADRGLADDPDATYTCPLLSRDDRCLVHGPAQPAGCLTFKPVDDGGCDHDLEFFHRHFHRIDAADRSAFGKRSEAVPIPVALLKVLGRK